MNKLKFYFFLVSKDEKIGSLGPTPEHHTKVNNFSVTGLGVATASLST